ncbi:acyltransferase family protein [Pedobacter soli]|uniref:Peptidoglycan/LPS O-acetylase OafA/YrhL, contains acyltransferase and SGNH-hydrolase domains n=1 Tax=Pedobacter soli TaxID=390242 RepID=A0A1G6SPH1_9SPHI|nr:acyltransferase [Pedobacter soli]SDD18770.1 Peptidoglycan/LPS O-acetylase OafA/YrhL, contains acyltransferase and SGNH-hydrolase domains [Pedobacter soli]
MITAENRTNLLSTKQHFEILDGLRGVAAIVVVIFHFMEIAITDYSKNFVGHGYLAVDFFFCLSGFVIAYAYDTRAPHIGITQFFKLRLIRLHPLVVIGAVLGLLTFLFDPFSDFYPVYGFGKTALLFLTTAFLIPYPIMPERYTNLFCLNAPAWSLFWEYVANIFYILLLYKINKKALISLVLVGAAVLCYVAVHSKNVGGGWGGQNFWDGGARVLYSFTAGMLVYRFNLIIKNKLGFLGVTALLLVAFVFPYSDDYNWITEPIIVLLYFPLLVALGAGATLSPALKNACRLSGEISYPLYMTHYPFLWIYLTYVAVVKPKGMMLFGIIPICVILLIILAYLIMRFIDIPLRKYLKDRFLTKE